MRLFSCITFLIALSASWSSISSAAGAELPRPLATPPGHYFTRPVTVRLSLRGVAGECAGAEIVYTDDGTDPRQSATAKLFRDSIRIPDEMCIVKAFARAVHPGCVSSDVVVETYIQIEPLPEPVAIPGSGPVEPGTKVALGVPGYEDVSDVKIYYTTDGSDPVVRGALYEAPVALERSAQIRAVAVSSIGFYLNSPVVSRDIEVVRRVLPAPVADPPSTNFRRALRVALSAAVAQGDPNAVTRYTIDRSDPDTRSPVYEEPLRLAATTTVKAAVMGSNGEIGPVTEELYVRGPDPVVRKPVADPPGGIFRGGIPPVSLSCPTPDARVCYTLDGSEVSMAATLWNGAPIRLAGNTLLKAAAFKVDHVPSVEITERYELAQLPTPEANPPAGTVVSDTQLVELSVPGLERDSVVGIVYSLDGSRPGPDALPYRGPVAVAGNRTIRAMARGAGFVDSPVAVFEYYAFAQVVAAVYRDADGDGRMETVILRFDREVDVVPGVIEFSDPGSGEVRHVNRDQVAFPGCGPAQKDCGPSVAVITIEPALPMPRSERAVLYGTITIPGRPDPYAFTVIAQ